MEQGFQGWEYKFNSVSSSRGDYPFITMTSGTDISEYGKLVTKTMLEVRAGGQGKPGHKKPVDVYKRQDYLHSGLYFQSCSEAVCLDL